MTAKEIIERVWSIKTIEEAKEFFEEEQEWIKSAPAEEVALIRDSGAGEMLYMMSH